MRINIGLLVINVINALTDPMTLTFDLSTPKTTSFLGYPSLNVRFLSFALDRQTNKQTNRQTEPNMLPTLTDSVGEDYKKKLE